MGLIQFKCGGLEKGYCERIAKKWRFGLGLTLSRIMLKNGHTYFQNVAVWTPQDF